VGFLRNEVGSSLLPECLDIMIIIKSRKSLKSRKYGYRVGKTIKRVIYGGKEGEKRELYSILSF
jgi:hypothetical protein